MSLTLENPALIQAAYKMESRIQSAPLYPTRLTLQDHTLIFVRAALPIPKNNKGKLRRLHRLNSALVGSP